MKIKANLQAPRFNRPLYVKRLNEVLSEALAQAAFAWLGAVTSEIPTWSGASQATFLPLARELGFQLSIQAAPGAPRRVNLGLRSSEGEFEVDANKGVFQFSYNTTLPHLVYNEYNNANANPDPTLFGQLHKPGPYGFQKIGQDAFLQALDGLDLPDPLSGMKITRIRVK